MERKVKYDLAFKLKCVKEVLEDYTSVNSISSREGFNESLLRKWFFEYQSKGIDGLITKPKNNKYSQSFKDNVLKTIERENLSLCAACLNLISQVNRSLSMAKRFYYLWFRCLISQTQRTTK